MKKALLTALLTLSVISHAMDLSLEKAIELGLENNTEVKNENLNYENYEIQRKEAIKTALPTITHTVSILEEENDEDTNYQKISLSQPIFTGGKVITAIKNSKKYLEQGELNLEKTKRETKQDIIEQYTNILKLEENRKILEDSRLQLEENYKNLDEQFNVGLITKTSLLEMRYSIIEIESQIIEIENNSIIAKLNLKNNIGIDSRKEIELNNIYFDNEELDKIDLEEDIKTTIETGIDAKMVKIGTELVKANQDIVRADLLPKVNFVLNYENKTNDYLDDSEFDWTYGIEMELYSFNFGSNKDAYKRAKNESKKQKNTEKSAIDNIELNIKSKYYELERLEKLIEAKEESVESAKENYNLEKEKLIAGITTTTDFLAAENRLRESDIDLINTNIDLYVKYNDYINTIN